MDRDLKNGMDSKAQTSKIIEWLEDLKSEDVKRRVISVSKLREISAAFGPKKTRDQILPFLIGRLTRVRRRRRGSSARTSRPNGTSRAHSPYHRVRDFDHQVLQDPLHLRGLFGHFQGNLPLRWSLGGK